MLTFAPGIFTGGGLTPSLRAELSVWEAAAALGRGWVPNAGQWDDEAAYSAPGFFGTTWVTRNGELRHVLLSRSECNQLPTEGTAAPGPRLEPCAARTWVLSEGFVGGQVSEIRGEQALPTQVSYFIGDDSAKHQTGLPSYQRLSLGEVWPGVAVTLKATQRTVEKVFEVKPFADPSVIRIALQGAEALRLNENADLVVSTDYGDVVFSKPIAWQEEGTAKKPVRVNYRVDAEAGTYAFTFGEYDKTKPLYIDPIIQSTFLGGSGDDGAYGLAINPSTGDVYVAGGTASTDFPRTSGGVGSTNAGAQDAFVARLSSDLSTVYQATYLGGTANDSAVGLVIASSGEVYVAGITYSSDFPGTVGGAQKTAPSPGDAQAFVAKLNGSLTQIVQSTYFGGLGRTTSCNALAIHPATGDVYITGLYYWYDLPGASGGAQPNYGGGLGDGYVARLSGDLHQILQSTYLGGNYEDWTAKIAVHPGTGDVYVVGTTYSTNFPNTSGGVKPTGGGTYRDGFVARLNRELTQLIQATYLGGGNEDWIYALAISPTTGDVYVAGETFSTDFPGTSGGAQQAHAGGSGDAFVARLNSGLTQLVQSTYLGGPTQREQANALAIHPNTGDVYVAGQTRSNDFPGTTGGAQWFYGGGFYDGFVARLNSSLTQLFQSTYLGGSAPEYPGYDAVSSIAISPSGDVIVAGTTSSRNFRTTSGAAQRTYGGGSYDAFVVRLTADLKAPPFTLTVNVPGSPPGGRVTSNPPGIDCGSGGTACSAAYGPPTTVTLTATADTGYLFVSWSGDCSGTSPSVTLTMDADKACTAQFSNQVTLTVVTWGSGSGTVTSNPPGINCGQDCSEVYQVGTQVTLTATPAQGSVFAGWFYDCSGTNPTTTMTMNGNKTCLAMFNQTSGSGGQPPAAPQNVAATPGDGQVTLTWGAVQGATSYNIYMATQSGVTKANWQTKPGGMQHTGITGTSYTHTGLQNGTTYYFVVTAVNAAGESAESAEVSATPQASGGGTSGTVNTPGGQVQVGLQGGTFTQGPAAQSVTPPQGWQAPYGGITFTAQVSPPGGILTVTLTFPQPIPQGAQLWKFVNNQWQAVPNAQLSGNTATFQVQDGGSLDADGQANGQVVDPVALLVPGPGPGAQRLFLPFISKQ